MKMLYTSKIKIGTRVQFKKEYLFEDDRYIGGGVRPIYTVSSIEEGFIRNELILGFEEKAHMRKYMHKFDLAVREKTKLEPQSV